MHSPRTFVRRVAVALRLDLRRFEDRGAGLVEYALLVALIAVICISAIAFVGTQTESNFSTNAISIQLSS